MYHETARNSILACKVCFDSLMSLPGLRATIEFHKSTQSRFQYRLAIVLTSPPVFYIDARVFFSGGNTPGLCGGLRKIRLHRLRNVPGLPDLGTTVSGRENHLLPLPCEVLKNLCHIQCCLQQHDSCRRCRLRECRMTESHLEHSRLVETHFYHTAGDNGNSR